MTHTRPALRELSALAGVLGRKLALPPISRCCEQAEARAAPDAPPERESQSVVEALRRDLQAACTGRDSAAALPWKVLRKAPLVLWNEPIQAATFPGLLDAFLDLAGRQPRALRDLIEAWLRDFGPDRVMLKEVGYAIARMLADTRHPKLLPWHDAHRKYSLFNAEAGPREVGRSLFGGPETIEEVLRATGMTDPLRADGRYFRAAVASGLEIIPDILDGPSVWQRLSGFMEMPYTERDKFGRAVNGTRLRFQELVGETGRACLEPWRFGGAPLAVSRDDVKAFLLRVIGDPRISSDRWKPVGEDCTALMRAWISEATLEAFLSLINQNNADSQWRYRQAFWRACLRKMPTAEVRVVLGPRLAAHAKSIPKLAGDFGIMQTGGDQAVLLMKMGNLVLSEWSNVGPVRAWIYGSRECPSLRSKAYQATELRNVSLDFPEGAANGMGLWHRGGAQGDWQRRAAALLRERLQLSLTPKDYMP